MMYNPRAVQWHVLMSEVLPAFIDNAVNLDITAPEHERQQSVTRASTMYQQFWAVYLVESEGRAMVFIHNQSIGCRYGHYVHCGCRYTQK